MSDQTAEIPRPRLTAEQIVRWNDTYTRMAAARQAEADAFAANLMPTIRELQAEGIKTLEGLADALNARGVRSAHGRAWYATTVRNLLRRGG